MASTTAPSTQARRRRGYWLKQLHRWHWISAAISLVGMLLFAITGITLNHAGAIEASPTVATRTATLPAEVLRSIAAPPGDRAPLPPALRAWAAGALAVKTGAAEAEWSESEIYLALPEPGGDAWLSIDRATGAARYERTTRGWISYLNDLHKGRNAGAAWAWFIDVFAGACIVFTLTGLILLQLHAAHRPSTWPLVGAGLLVPALLALFFIHA